MTAPSPVSDRAPELAITWSRRLHYSTDLQPQDAARPERGREGHAICNGSISVFDETWWRRYPNYGYAHPNTPFDLLPRCGRCAKKAGSSL